MMICDHADRCKRYCNDIPFGGVHCEHSKPHKAETYCGECTLRFAPEKITVSWYTEQELFSPEPIKIETPTCVNAFETIMKDILQEE